MNFKKLLSLALVLASLVSTAHADYSFYSAFSLAPGATAQGDLLFPASTQGIAIGVSTFDNAAQQIRLYNGASGATKPTNIQLEIETAANGGVNISNASANISGYYYSNPSGSYDGGIEYANTARSLALRTAGTTKFTISSSGDLTSDATNGGDVILSRSGKTISIQENTASTACLGVTVPNGTTPVTVTTSCATTAARVIYSRNGAVTNVGSITTTTAPNGTSFAFASTNAADTGASVVWFIIKESA